jgi:hypothetical protein
VPRDLRLGPHSLGDGEGVGEQRVQRRPDRLARLGQRERVLHLAEDLRLADHHGIQAGRDAEGVTDRVVLGVRVEQRLHGREVDAAVAAQSPERDGAGFAGDVGHAVHLHPVARRQDDRLAQHAVGDELAQDLTQLVLVDGQLLAQRHRRVLVAHARGEESHQAPCRPGRTSPAPRVRTSAAKPMIAK